MFNKFVIVLALLTTLSMATKLEVLSDDDECEYGTLQEVMDKSKRIYEKFEESEILEGEEMIKLAFLKKLAKMAGISHNPKNDDENNKILHQFAGYISTNVSDKVKESRYFEAKNLLINELNVKDQKTMLIHLFASSYIKSLLETKKEVPGECLRKMTLIGLFIIR
jgi:hypothetical protein